MATTARRRLVTDTRARRTPAWKRSFQRLVRNCSLDEAAPGTVGDHQVGRRTFYAENFIPSRPRGTTGLRSMFGLFGRLPAVLGDVVKVVTADDDGVGHLAGGDHETLVEVKRTRETPQAHTTSTDISD